MSTTTNTDPAVSAARVYFGESDPDPLLWATFIAGYMAAVCDATNGTLRAAKDGRMYIDIAAGAKR